METKEKDLERELTDEGHAKLSGAEAKHDKFGRSDVTVTVPGHREIKETTAKGIRKEAGLI